MTAFVASRDALFDVLRRAFSPQVMTALYGGAAPQVPSVLKGYPVTMPPFCVFVDLMPHDVTMAGGATGSQHKVTHSVGVYCCAVNTNRDIAVGAVNAYADVVFGAVLSDPFLAHSVDMATPHYVDGGVDATSDKKYIAAVQIDVRCQAWSLCAGKIKELLNAGA